MSTATSSSFPIYTSVSGTRHTVPEYLKYWTMGIILSGIAYGAAFTLSVSTLVLLHQSRSDKAERRRYILMAYVIVMISLATISLASGIYANLVAIQNFQIPSDINVGRDENTIMVVLVVWGSDGFLSWRAIALYDGISKSRRKLVLALIGSLMFSLTICGILYILITFIPSLNSRFAKPIFIAFASTTLAVNWIMTGMVVFRIGIYRDRLSLLLGTNYARPLTKIMVMCTESAMLIILFSSIFLFQNLTDRSPFSLARILLVQIYVIAPLLILYRVAQSKPLLTHVPSNNTSFVVSRRNASTTLDRSTSLRVKGSRPQTATSTKTLEVMIMHDIHTDYPESDLELERNNPLSNNI